jgi:predicted small secreted protein
MKKIILLMLAAVIFVIATIGCNTLRGAGTDIKNTGKAVENIGD